MKTSTILIVALVLIIVFVGGMSASGLVKEQSATHSVETVGLSDLKQMLESSKAQISEHSQVGIRDIRVAVVNDFERLM